MGTTSRGYPYPEGTDLVIGGDDAIEALAQAVDSDIVTLDARADANLVNVCAVIAQSDTDIAVGTTPGVVPFPGTVLALNGFLWDGQTLTYDGAGVRDFLVMAEVTTNVQNVGDVSTTVQLRANGAVFTGSFDRIDRQDTGFVRRDYTHRLVAPVRLAPGDFLDVVASGNVANTIDLTGLRVYPIGPVA